MKNEKNTPQDLIKDAGLKLKDLGGEGKELIEIYEEIQATIAENPDDSEVQEQANANLDLVMKKISLLIQMVPSKDKKPSQESAEDLSSKLGLTEETIAECKEKISEYRKQKAELSEPKPKKSRITKLKERLLALVSLIPKEMKDDEAVLCETEEILLDTLEGLAKLWGLKRIQGAEKAIEEKFNQLEEKATS